MYCPQCGQQQIGDEGVRFCSRCGFQLKGVTALLHTGGTLPQPGDWKRLLRTTKREGIKQGVMLMLLGIVLVPVLAILNSYGFVPELFVALTAVVCFLGGPVRMAYALLFEEGPLFRKKNKAAPNVPAFVPAAVTNARRDASLPPGYTPAPVSLFDPQRGNTAEITSPPSITENSARLFEVKAAERRRRENPGS